ncbi:MAG: dethiobiotin synthase [Gammaproteobacteria bacterium]|nr:dethiobiotin synthase [Gammaproteobacteria bacterium]MCB1850499.1 dethiobiotin synthase [Gammaproteobacteria bacterium]MCP5415861.1 dethiobiotin synthase [Chromatiaceae bacterium]
MVSGYFITGTDTGCGKTLVTLGLMQRLQLAGLRVAGMKPVASGAARVAGELRNDDATQIQTQSSGDADYGLVNPYVFEPAIAPHLAARQSGREIEIAEIEACYRKLAVGADRLLVEGVGGWLVPLSDDCLLSDLAVRLRLPVIMVVGMRLGCINHSLLTQDGINGSGCHLIGWVANRIDPGMSSFDDNIATLQQRIAAPLLGVLPHLDRPDPLRVVKHLQLPASEFIR